jgi:hypothetical protein
MTDLEPLLDLEARELRHPFGAFCALGFPDVAVHPLFHSVDKRADLRRYALYLQLHPPIRQILHNAGNLELLRHLQRAVAEADSLHAAREKDRFMMYFRHSCGARTLGGSERLTQPAKNTADDWRETGFCIALSRAGQHGAARSFYQHE